MFISNLVELYSFSQIPYVWNEKLGLSIVSSGSNSLGLGLVRPADDSKHAAKSILIFQSKNVIPDTIHNYLLPRVLILRCGSLFFSTMDTNSVSLLLASPHVEHYDHE